MNFKELLNKRVDFYGVDNNCFCVGYRGKRYAFEALEDENDGYRSMLDEIARVPIKGHIFFHTPVARVFVQSEAEIDGYKLVDTRGGHVWLRMGTDHRDDYYPTMVFDYQPKQPKS